MDQLPVSCSAIIVMILAIVALIGFLYIKYSNRKIKEAMHQQIEDLNAFKASIEEMNKNLLESIAGIMNKELHDNNDDQAHKHQQELMSTFDKVRQITRDDLFSALNSTSACRIALYLLHNGTKSINGISFLKISCIGERTLPGSGIREQIMNHTNMPINIFDNMIAKLIDNGRYLIINDEETMLTARSQFISHPKIQYSQAVAIYDTSNNIIGFILGEYDSIYTKENSDIEYNDLKALAQKISPILTISDYSKIAAKEKN